LLSIHSNPLENAQKGKNIFYTVYGKRHCRNTTTNYICLLVDSIAIDSDIFVQTAQNDDFFSYCSIIFFVFFQRGRMRNPEGWWRIVDTESFSSYIYGQTVRPLPLVTGFVTIISPNYLLLIFILSTEVNIFPL